MTVTSNYSTSFWNAPTAFRSLGDLERLTTVADMADQELRNNVFEKRFSVP